nr:MAG TPA: hypothetical protein [Caudoviricetes sp.]
MSHEGGTFSGKTPKAKKVIKERAKKRRNQSRWQQ